MAEHIKLIKEEVCKSIAAIEADWERSYAEAAEAKIANVELDHAVLGYTEHKVIVGGREGVIHRVFVQARDSGLYAKLGWVLKSEVTSCMVCAKKFQHEITSMFGFVEVPAIEGFYCHACGNLVCGDCCSPNVVVEEIKVLGPVTVCKQCDFGQVT